MTLFYMLYIRQLHYLYHMKCNSYKAQTQTYICYTKGSEMLIREIYLDNS